MVQTHSLSKHVFFAKWGKNGEYFRFLNLNDAGTWGVDYALFRSGELLHDPYCYRDGRTEVTIEDFHKKIGKVDFYARNGIQPLVFNTIYQLCAELRDDPAALDGSTMLLMPDALHYMLTSKYTDMVRTILCMFLITLS